MTRNQDDDKEMYDRLFEKKSEIEGLLGFKLEWKRLDNRKSSIIKHRINGLNFDDHSNYDELIDKTIDAAVKMRDVFKKYI